LALVQVAPAGAVILGSGLAGSVAGAWWGGTRDGAVGREGATG
jgi:hypothetical protein